MTGLPENHYRRKLVLCLTLLRALTGASLLVKNLRQTHIRDFLQTVCKLPSDWGKRFKENNVPLSVLLAEDAQRNHGAGISTSNRSCGAHVRA